jgi:hypothetical protein
MRSRRRAPAKTGSWVFTRPLKTLAIRVQEGQRQWQAQTPAMEAGLTDHQWTVKEPLLTAVAHK